MSDSLNDSRGRKLRAPVLNPKQCEQVVSNALDALEGIGCEIPHEPSLALLKKAGCKIEGSHAMIPSKLVWDCIATTPSAIQFYTRDGEPAFELNGNMDEPVFSSGYYPVSVVDAVTYESRPTSQSDAARTATLVDRLANIDMVGDLAYANDCPGNLADAYSTRSVIAHTSKPFMMEALTVEGIKASFEMCHRVAGSKEAFVSKPFATPGVMALSPLRHSNENLDVFMEICREGLPVEYIASPAIGVSGPLTLAGSLSVALADTFVGLVINQLVREGNPFIGTCNVDISDFSTMNFTATSPEFILSSMAVPELYRYLNLPSLGHLCGTASPVFDSQAVFDITIGLLSTFLAGGCVNSFLGFVDDMMSGSLEALVFCDEAIGYLKRMMAPIEVSEETLAYETIEEAGIGGSYLMLDHTLDNYDCLWSPSVFTRKGYAQWSEEGQLDLNARLKNRVEELVAQGPRKPLPDEVLADLNSVLSEAC